MPEDTQPKKEDWMIRLDQEHDELENRFNKLTDFLQTQKFADLPPKDRALLANQYYHMEGYLVALRRRKSLILEAYIGKE